MIHGGSAARRARCHREVWLRPGLIVGAGRGGGVQCEVRILEVRPGEGAQVGAAGGEQGIGVIDQVGPTADLIARWISEYEAAKTRVA